MSQAGRKLVIAIPIFDGIMALDAIGPFDCVQQLPNVEVVFVSHKPGPYKASYGALSLIATASFDDVPSPDVIIVPGGSGTRLLLEDEPLLKWIQKVLRPLSGTRPIILCFGLAICSCDDVFLLDSCSLLHLCPFVCRGCFEMLWV